MIGWRGLSVAIFLLALFLLPIMVKAADKFEVSPAEFTVGDVPPLGEPWEIPEKIIIWNGDNRKHLFAVAAEIPSENAVRPGYEPIPQENWVIPFPSSVMIPENSYAEIHVLMNIPRWENLTGQKWEVWIRTRRQPLPGEIGLETISRMKIETTEELPAKGEGDRGIMVLLGLGILIALAVTVAVVWMWSRGW